MREWGSTILYGGWSEVEKIINYLLIFVCFLVENFLDFFFIEFYGEEGLIGFKEKDNWYGDERW